MADTDKLQNMLDDLINQKPEQAQVAFHDYLQNKMQDLISNVSAEEKASTTETPDKE